MNNNENSNVNNNENNNESNSVSKNENNTENNTENSNENNSEDSNKIQNNTTSPPPIQDQTIGQNMKIIKNSIGNIGDDIKTNIANTAGNVVGFMEDPMENIEKMVKSLRHVPAVLDQIVEDPQFIKQVKVTALTLAQALSDSVEIMTPYMMMTTSLLISKLTRAGFLGILDGVGVVPYFGEVVELLLIFQDAIMTILNVTRATVQITDISSLLLDNTIRIYKQNEQKLKANHGRIINSENSFQNTNSSETSSQEQSQQGGKKRKSKAKTKVDYYNF